MPEVTLIVRTCDYCGRKSQHQKVPAEFVGRPFFEWYSVHKSGFGEPGVRYFCSAACVALAHTKTEEEPKR